MKYSWLILLLLPSLAFSNDFLKQYQSSRQSIIEQLQGDSNATENNRLRNETEIRQQELVQTLIHTRSLPETGNPDGSKVVLLFTDYDCSYCKKLEPELNKLSNQDKKVRVIKVLLPMMGQGSELAAGFALTLFNQSPPLFQRFHNALVKNRGPLTPPVLKQALNQAGQNHSLKISQQAHSRLLENQKLAQAFGIGVVPALIYRQTVKYGYQDLPNLIRLIR